MQVIIQVVSQKKRCLGTVVKVVAEVRPNIFHAADYTLTRSGLHFSFFTFFFPIEWKTQTSCSSVFHYNLHSNSNSPLLKMPPQRSFSKFRKAQLWSHKRWNFVFLESCKTIQIRKRFLKTGFHWRPSRSRSRDRFRPSENRKSESSAESERFHFLSRKWKPKNKPSTFASDNLVFTG